MERHRKKLSASPRPIGGLFCNLADLHVHLGATTSPGFLWELAHKQGLRLPHKNYHTFIRTLTLSRKKGHTQYLKKIGKDAKESTRSPFNITHTIQSSPLAVEECVHAALAGAYRKTGITLLELRFNPMFRNRNGEHDLDKIVLSATIGMKRACIEYPIRAGLIFETDRQFTKEQHEIIVQKAVEFKQYGVVGIDVSGPSPKHFRVDTLVHAFATARKNGLKTTFHTGEYTGNDEMWEVVRKLKPNRIGHGIKATSDGKLMKHLKTHAIALELCPTSNVATGIVSGWEELGERISHLKNAGIPLTINSDGPEFLQTNVKKELQLLLEKQIFTPDDVIQSITNSHTFSFI